MLHINDRLGLETYFIYQPRGNDVVFAMNPQGMVVVHWSNKSHHVIWNECEFVKLSVPAGSVKRKCLNALTQEAEALICQKGGVVWKEIERSGRKLLSVIVPACHVEHFMRVVRRIAQETRENFLVSGIVGQLFMDRRIQMGDDGKIAWSGVFEEPCIGEVVAHSIPNGVSLDFDGEVLNLRCRKHHLVNVEGVGHLQRHAA